jgi:gliding motility-associated-like protein
MSNFTMYNVRIKFILVFLFIGAAAAYSQQNHTMPSQKGTIRLNKENVSKDHPGQTVLHTKSQSSPTSKKAADTEAPSITCPPNQLLACGSLVPSYFGLLTVTDNVDTEILVTQSPGEGSDFYDGMEITFTATDQSGNKSECTIIVAASSPDVTPPTFTCPTGLTLNCGDLIPNYAVSPIMNLDDDCSINLTYIMTPGAGTQFYDGIPIQIEYFDKTGNRSVCNFTIGMATPDVTDPVITSCPGTQILACGEELPDYKDLIAAYDTCLQDMYVFQSPPPGSEFIPGMTVTMTVKDAANNEATCSFVVNGAADVTKPVISCPGNQTLTPGTSLPDYTSMVTVTDNCDTNPSLVQDPPAGTPFSAGMTVNFTATDASGNYSNCSFIVNSGAGDLAPVIVCPSDQVLYANATLPDYVSYLNTVTDDITDGFDLVFTQTPPQGTLFTADTNVTITVTDESGNTSSCTFLVKLKTTTESINCKTISINLSNLDGLNGFKIFGEKLTREAGFSVSNAGDVNGDGISDLVIGAPGNYNSWYGPNRIYKIIKGAAFVVYGTASGFSPNVDLGLLNGTNGFAIRNDIPSPNFPLTGYDVSSAGDINGDGVDDFMISDPFRHSSYGPEVGHTYVIFGNSSGFPAEFNLSTLNGSNGFTLIGEKNYGTPGYQIAAVGDINGDGFNDIAAVTGGSGEPTGKCFIVYGKAGGFPAILRTFELNGTNGFSITGDVAIGIVGTSVAGLGDVNGDGIPDIGIGSYNGSGQKRKFVVFGRSSNFPPSFSISSLNGSNGFILENSVNELSSYYGIAKAGDLNNDGLNDIAVTGGYILFGRTSYPTTVDLSTLDGTNGFTIANSATSSFGYAGDFNADGIDDYFVSSSSSTNILFGKSTWSANVNLNVDKSLRFTYGSYMYDYSASYAGDVNNDGIGDFIIGTAFDSYGSNLKVNGNPGMSYVIFGKNLADTEKPVISNCPSAQVLAAGATIPNFLSQITVTDDCDNNPTRVQSPVAGTIFDGITQNVTITITDAAGNKEECIFSISAEADTEDPVITNCLTDQTVACSTTVVPNYTQLITATDNVDSNPVVTQSPIAGSTYTAGMTVTITVTDATGNSAVCSFKVNTEADTDKPIITACPGAQTLAIGAQIPNYVSQISVTDNCDDSPTIVQSPVAGTIFDGITQNVTITITDAAGNKEECIFSISAEADIEDPVITNCLTDQTVACSTTVVPDYAQLITATDNVDSNPVVTQSPIAGSTYTAGMTVTITATDATGNSAVCSFKVNTEADTDKPIITACPGAQTLAMGAQIPNYVSQITVTDNCDNNPTRVQSPVAGTIFDGITQNVTITITDAAGNKEECIFSISAEADTEDPVITNCLTDQTVACSTTVVPDYAQLITATDNVDSNPVVTQSPIAGSTYTAGMTVTITATDATGNSAVCSFKVNTEADTDKPIITACPGAQTLAMGAQIPNYVSQITVTDNCDNNPTRVQSPVAGTIFDGITQNVTITITDAAGNKEECIFSISAEADTEDPVITNCLTDQTVACSTTVVPDYAQLITATDNVDSNPVVTQSPIAGSTYTAGMTVTITVTDATGNSAVCSFKVNTEADTDKPVITACPGAQTLAIGAQIPNYVSQITVTDNCDNNPTRVQSPVAGTIFDGVMQNATITITDAAGNKQECIFSISAEADTEDPVITNCLTDQTVACNTNAVPDYTGSITATDNVDLSPVITQSPVEGSALTDGMSVTITATDAAGNSTDCTFKIYIEADTEKPVFSNCVGIQILSVGTPVPDFTTLAAVTDNCDASSVITQSLAAGTIYDGTTQTVTLTATDAAGNSETCTFTIAATADTESPVISNCLTDQTLACNTNVLPDYTGFITATDNVDLSPVITQNPVGGSALTDGMSVTITATDAAGNSTDCTFKIYIEADTEKPVFSNCVGIQILSVGTPVPDFTALAAVTDNCDVSLVITQSLAAGTIYDGTTQTVTLTATDAAGNSETCTFTIAATADTESPVITNCLTDQTVACNTNVVPDYTGSITATDNVDLSPVITQSPVEGSALTDGMSVTITATDAAGNSTDCTFKIYIEADTEKPIFSNCVGIQILSVRTPVPDFTALAAVTDNCDVSSVITQSLAAGVIYDGTTQTVTLTATDAAGNSETCTFSISATADTENPVITNCLTDQTVACNTNVVPDYTGSITATDNVDLSPVITQSPVEGSALTDGMTVTITATDATGNSTDCNFKIYIEADTEKPIFSTCVNNQILNTGVAIPNFNSLISITDNCDPDPFITQTPAAGVIYDGTTQTVTLTATDAAGNSETCTFSISATADTENPVITNCLSDQTVACNTNVVPDYTGSITATDNVDLSPVITQNPIGGSAFTDGMTVTITATDAAGNIDECSFKVFSPILLVDAGADQVVKEGEVVQLEAVATEEGTFSWSPATGMTNSSVYNPVVSPTQTTTYKVNFTSNNGCTVEDSVTITVIPKEKDETKYGFSPNNDGINDVWIIDHITEYPNNTVSIYNRWGDLVFQTTGYNNTTNVFAGIANKKRKLGADELPEGTYFFEINPNAPTHNFKKLKGYLVLKR